MTNLAANSLLAWNNYAKAATITASTAATNMQPVNMATDSGSPATAWQTTFGATTQSRGAAFAVDPAGSGQTWDVIGLFRTNLTAGATVSMSLWTGATQVWSATYPGPQPGYGAVIGLPPTGTVANLLQVYFNDPTNPDGYINVPLLFCGAAWRPLGSVAYASTVGRDAALSEATSRGGQDFPTLYYQRRRWNVQIDSLRSAEVWSYADPLLTFAAAGSNVLFIPDTTSPYFQQEAIFGRLKALADFSYPAAAADRRRWQAQITERL